MALFEVDGTDCFTILTISDWVSVTGDLAAVHVHVKVWIISYLTILLDT
jgi:hypothetical protein